ncbi:MAG: alpha/beta fold hydrolase [Thermoproteota archaeon]|nr:alpha/beta fold hydrolase [Thermoproteota archaeon]MDQ3983746.1 alpha/beta fold hydrolase [Thermoproteota archaeon]
MDKKNNIVTVLIAVISIAIIVSGSFVSIANSQSEKPLPVLLIHGYAEDAAIWKKWEELLKKDGIQFFTITFKDSDDKCGSAEQHAKELEKRVQDIKQQSGAQKINIVGHSKGGLDARVFLDITDTTDVANLIMIGTPNAGSPAAETNDACAPAIFDLRPGANATRAEMNPNIKYYTITGDWLPAVQGNPAIPGHDDGLVPVESVESEGYFQSLGRTEHGHAELLQEQEYNMAKDVLLGKR